MLLTFFEETGAVSSWRSRPVASWTLENLALRRQREIFEGQVSVRFEGGDESANKRRNHAACCRAAGEGSSASPADE